MQRTAPKYHDYIRLLCIHSLRSRQERRKNKPERNEWIALHFTSQNSKWNWIKSKQTLDFWLELDGARWSLIGRGRDREIRRLCAGSVCAHRRYSLCHDSFQRVSKLNQKLIDLFVSVMDMKLWRRRWSYAKQSKQIKIVSKTSDIFDSIAMRLTKTSFRFWLKCWTLPETALRFIINFAHNKNKFVLSASSWWCEAYLLGKRRHINSSRSNRYLKSIHFLYCSGAISAGGT